MWGLFCMWIGHKGGSVKAQKNRVNCDHVLLPMKDLARKPYKSLKEQASSTKAFKRTAVLRAPMAF